MKPLSRIHPLNPLPPGRYIIDADGILWPTEVAEIMSPVAAVTVKAKPAQVTPPAPVAQRRPAKAKREPMMSEPKLDALRIAAAFRSKKLGPKAKSVPTRRAMTNGECPNCGTRTIIGCEHLLPYQGDAQ